jgi:DNA invertase Pin-like site-specific DNA recombinase
MRAVAYIRDSTLDQRDGFGPDIQTRNVQRLAESYGLILGEKWYTEFISGRHVKKRVVFQQFIEDA